VKLFRNRETPNENIAFLAMMAALVAIVSLIAALLPLSSIAVMILVPLFAASVSIFCKGRYIPIFLIGAFGLAMALSAWNFTNTIFYVLPSLVTGVAYGLFWKLKLPSSLSIFLTSIIGFLLFLLSLKLVELFTGINMQSFLLAIIKKEDSPSAPLVFPLFCLAYSVAQIAIAHIFLSFELSRLSVKENADGSLQKFYPLISIGFSILSLICGFFSLKTAYLFLGFSLFWTVASCPIFLKGVHSITWVALGISLFASLLLFAFALPRIEGYAGMLILLAPLALIDGCVYLNLLLRRKKSNLA